MISAVLFDMDGLIFDTESLYKKSWEKAIEEQNLRISNNYYKHFIGVQDSKCEQMLVNYFGEQINLDKFKDVRDRHFHNARSKGIKYKKGFHDLFHFLLQNEIDLALVTSSCLLDVKYNFSDSNYLNSFNTIITAEDVKNGKPNPDCYLLACQKLCVSPQHTLVLEDSNHGMKAGIDAGCKTIMIPDLQSPKKETKEQADYILTSLDEVISTPYFQLN